jgi:hypothetical protein
VLDGIYENYQDDLAVISYHAWWPSSNDPYYQHNIPENTARINYYGADYTPHLWIDGDVDGQWLTGGWEGLILGEMALPSPLVINLVVDHDNIAGTGTVDAVISATGPLSGHNNLYLRVAIIESDLPPYGNYTNPINHAMRDMLPDATGQSLSISPGNVVTKQVSYMMDSEWDFANLDVVAFVQCDDEHRVLQATRYTMPGAHVSLVPTGDLVVPKGGTLYFDSDLRNYSGSVANGDFWLTVVLPSGNEVVIPESYLNWPNPLTGEIRAWGSVGFSHELSIPASGVQAGMYSIVGNIGIYPDVVGESSSFDFMVTD